jgi:uncharacterized 2Fe-2S/4Fe-4S cluster protein (DUF4445 family)
MTLAELLAEQGYDVRADCGGLGKCGKCRVRIKGETGSHSVLACQYIPAAPVTVLGAKRATLTPSLSLKGRGRTRARVLAVDVGTTTVSMAVADKKTRRVVARHDLLNPQLVYGADVMSRISSRARVARVGLHELIREFGRERGIGTGATVTAVGNTVMAHFLLGHSPAGLGEHPYRSRLRLREKLVGASAGMRFEMLPLLGSFVGSDCTAAILGSGMHRRRELALLVDAGTNGEVVLGNCERLLVCSTAAGPAFEGATLECGSLAQPGAVRRVEVKRSRLKLDVVGRAEAKSICGSGVLDAVAAGRRLGRISASGRVQGGRLVLAREVFLSQADVREVQLAKAAIAAGIRILLSEWGADPRELERIHITGKFGAALSVNSARAVGLLPSVRARVSQHPNLALAGAVRAALDRGAWAEAKEVAGRSREVMLAEHPEFEETFVGSMELGPWS